jgi:hypothetical protein
VKNVTMHETAAARYVTTPPKRAERQHGCGKKRPAAYLNRTAQRKIRYDDQQSAGLVRPYGLLQESQTAMGPEAAQLKNGQQQEDEHHDANQVRAGCMDCRSLRRCGPLRVPGSYPP